MCTPFNYDISTIFLGRLAFCLENGILFFLMHRALNSVRIITNMIELSRLREKMRRKKEARKLSNYDSTLLCHLAWLNIKWFLWWCAYSLALSLAQRKSRTAKQRKNVCARALKFRSRVIWYKRSYRTLYNVQPFYNVISVIYNIYVRPFHFFPSSSFLFLRSMPQSIVYCVY